MVFPVVFAGFFEGDHILRISDDAQHILIPFGVATDITDRCRRQVKTFLANAHLFFGIEQGLGKGFYVFFGTLNDVQGKTLGGLGTDTGQALKLFDEAGEGGRINGRFLLWAKSPNLILNGSLTEFLGNLIRREK